jgi:flagellin
MSDVTLSAAVRSSLLSLQGTTKLIERTQSRLATGLSVAGPIDDPVKYFQAKTLSDRATDFQDKLSGIDQGISTLTGALDGAEAIEDIVGQMKGLALSAKSATTSTIGELVSQFNDLRTQIANLASDATYQGLNLINGTGSTLTVNFSTDTGSTLAANSVDVTGGGRGLAIRQAVTADAATAIAAGTVNVAYDYSNDLSVTTGSTIAIQFGYESAITFGSAGSYGFIYGPGTNQVVFVVGTALNTTGASFTTTQSFAVGTTLTFTVEAASAVASDFQANEAMFGNISASDSLSVGDVTGKYVVDAGITNQINSAVNDLDSALTTLRTKSQTLGSNVALLQTRLEFTESYVSTLQSGSDKLTLADLNEEGANLLALQTRQQLGISALSFAGQAEQGILALFR